ncbi:MAG TPA: PAS domain-containing protein [Gallionella sp.]|nr:PAS domain-containing protein [Gallionella sp.]
MSLQKERIAIIGSNFSFKGELDDRVDEPLAKSHDSPALSLDERGMIQDCNKSCEGLFGYLRRELVWQPVSSLFFQLAGAVWVRDGRFNPRLNFLCRCGKLFHAQNRQGDTFTSTLSFACLEYDGRLTLRLIVSPSETASP